MNQQMMFNTNSKLYRKQIARYTQNNIQEDVY